MIKADGLKCTSTEENVEVFHVHFQKLFGEEPEYRSNFVVLPQPWNLIRQLMMMKSRRSLKDKAPGEYGLLLQLWKDLLTDESIFGILKALVLDVCELPPQE